MRQHIRPHRCVGRRRDLPRYRRAVAWPGRTTSRRGKPKARGADDSRAGRRPPVHTVAGPMAPGTPVAPHSNTGDGPPPVGTQSQVDAPAARQLGGLGTAGEAVRQVHGVRLRRQGGQQ